MKIYILGAGGVGGYFGGKLAKAGNDVTFVARGDYFLSLKSNGLIVKAIDGDFEVNPVNVVDEISKIKSPDLIIFSVKTYDTKEVALELSKVINENTIIITFQNGIQNDLEIKKILPNAGIYPGVAYVISTKTNTGVINQTGGLRKLTFGDRNNSTNVKLKAIEDIMVSAKIDAVLSDDIEKDLWRKYVFINAFSGLTALCRSTIGEIREDKTAYALYESCVQEAIEVARKLKINLPESIFEDVMTITNNTAEGSKSSLLVDIENNRKNEIETLNGTLIRLAEENDIQIPINETIYCAIKMLKK